MRTILNQGSKFAGLSIFVIVVISQLKTFLYDFERSTLIGSSCLPYTNLVCINSEVIYVVEVPPS